MILLSAKPRTDVDPALRYRAFFASCALHGLVLCLLLGLAFIYGTKPLSHGSAPGAPITLAIMTVVPHPPEPKPQPLAAVPVIPAKTAPTPLPKVAPAPRPAIAHPATATAQPKPAATALSYAPGLDAFPHPPYPPQARERHQTGTVMMSVEFDGRGGVIQADVTKSSGIPVLDSSTKSFIRAHWRNPAFAGQTVIVPVQYTLENM